MGGGRTSGFGLQHYRSCFRQQATRVQLLSSQLRQNIFQEQQQKSRSQQCDQLAVGAVKIKGDILIGGESSDQIMLVIEPKYSLSASKMLSALHFAKGTCPCYDYGNANDLTDHLNDFAQQAQLASVIYDYS